MIATILMLSISLMFSVAATLTWIDGNRLPSLIMSFTAVCVVCSVGIAGQYQFAAAEDDCPYGVQSVVRLPLVGLVCVL